MKRIWTKSLAFALALLMAVSMAVPTPAQAASKKVEVKVNSPKKGNVKAPHKETGAAYRKTERKERNSKGKLQKHEQACPAGKP